MIGCESPGFTAWSKFPIKAARFIILTALGKDLFELVDHQHQSFFAILRQQTLGNHIKGLRFLGQVRTRAVAAADRFRLAVRMAANASSRMGTWG